jgi:hypothetical protein
MVCDPIATWNVCVIGVAAAKVVPLPGWLAVIEHVPAVRIVTNAFALTVQTEVKLEVNCTVNPELADAYPAIENGACGNVTFGG